MNSSYKLGVLALLAVAVGVALFARSTGRSVTEPPAPVVQSGTRPLPRLVDLGAGKCIPCKEMAPILEELRKEYAGRMDVQFIDVWVDPNAGRVFSIHMIPTQIFFAADGTELARHEGFMGKDEILAQWKALGVRL